MTTPTLYQTALNMPWAIEESWLPIILSAAKGDGDLVGAEKLKETYALELVEGEPLDGTELTTVRDGIAVIPKEVEKDALGLAREKIGKESLTRNELLAGKTLREVYDTYGVL